MRSAIDTQSHLLKNVLLNPTMRKEFLKGVPTGNEGKAVKAFVEMNKENMLKTKPKVSAVRSCACSVRFEDYFFRGGLQGGPPSFLPIVSAL